MNLLPGVTRITGDLLIGTSGRPIRVFTVNLVSTSTASVLTLRNGTNASATAWDQIDGTISVGITKNYVDGLLFPAGCFADADANISYATIVYTEEL